MSQFTCNHSTEVNYQTATSILASEFKHQSPPSYETIAPKYYNNAVYPSYSQPFPTAYAPHPPPSIFNTSSTTVIITNQPKKKRILLPAPTDYTNAAWLVCLCCFWPFGLAAIFFASASKSYLNSGNVVEAHYASSRARNFIIASVLVGIIVMGSIIGVNVRVR